MITLLSIAIDAVKDNSYSWIIAASLAPTLYFLTKKMHGIQRRKQSWLQKLMMKWVMKRTAKRLRKGKKMSKGAATLIAILAVLGVWALLVWLFGWLWAIVIACAMGLLGALLVAAGKEHHHEH